jgi:hypothetical protein
VSAELRVKFAELVRRQAVPYFIRVRAKERTLADLNDYAATFLKHLQSTHAADVRGGMASVERQTRLGGNLEYARRLYAQRASPHGAHAASLLETSLRTLLDAQRESTFAKDLMIAMAAAPSDEARTAARAS